MYETARTNSPYFRWLKIADELDAMHEFIYSDVGPFGHVRDSPMRPTGKEVAEWIRLKCSKGRWYWWDKTTLSGKADGALKTIKRVISDGGGIWEEKQGGLEMIKKIRYLEELIISASR